MYALIIVIPRFLVRMRGRLAEGRNSGFLGSYFSTSKFFCENKLIDRRPDKPTQITGISTTISRKKIHVFL